DPLRLRARPLLTPARHRGVERRRPGAVALGERDGHRRRRARLPGGDLPRRGRSRTHRRGRRRRGRALEPAPPAAAPDPRHRRAQGRQRRGQARLPQPGGRDRALPGASRGGERRGAAGRHRRGRRLLGLLRHALPRQRHLLRARRPARRGRRARAVGARDGDPSPGVGVLPLRVPGRARAGRGAELPRGRRARSGRGHRRLVPGARGDQAVDRRRRAPARPDPPDRGGERGADGDRHAAPRGLPGLRRPRGDPGRRGRRRGAGV
ncbi:MAG: Sulfur carrier protein adenylyltransferase ThiF, partial [uncultured Solirubrobacterales bacterium]